MAHMAWAKTLFGFSLSVTCVTIRNHNWWYMRGIIWCDLFQLCDRWFEIAVILHHRLPIFPSTFLAAQNICRKQGQSLFKKLQHWNRVNNASDRIKQCQQVTVPVWTDSELYPSGGRHPHYSAETKNSENLLNFHHSFYSRAVLLGLLCKSNHTISSLLQKVI